MAVFMMLTAFYGVVQLAVLAWPVRSVRLGTLAVAVTVGLYGCGSLALALQLLYTRLIASSSGQPLSEVVRHASYTVDPAIEEVVKILPLLIVLVGIRRLRPQWGLTDFLMLGAALGAGFALVEGLLRWGHVGRGTSPGPHGGWNVSVGLGASQHVTGLGEALGRWLPAPVYSIDPLSFSGATSVTQTLDLHLAWTAVAGFGVGVLVHARGSWKLLGLLPVLYTSADHATFNYVAIAPQGGGWFVHLMGDLRGASWLYPLALLALAVAFDARTLRQAKAAHPELLLASERSAATTDATRLPAFQALADFARVSPRFTAPIALRFVMARRSALYALSHDPESGVDALVAEVRRIREQMDSARDPAAWQAARQQLPRLADRLRQAARSWQLWVWLALLLPSVLYLVLGSFPSFSGLQRAVASKGAFPVVAIISAVGLVWMAWHLLSAARTIPGAIRRQYGEPVARTILRTWSGCGALAGGVASLATWAGGTGPNDPVIRNAHILDALSNGLLALAVALFLLSFFMFPPLGLAATTSGQLLFFLTPAAASWAAMVAASGVLGALGALLAMIAGGGSGSGGSGSGDGSGGDGTGKGGGGDPPDERQQRLNELAKDPAHGNQVTPASEQEARAALELEESGKLDGPVRRDPTGGADFIDGNNQDWDVKGFNSKYPPSQGGYSLGDSMTKISDAIRDGENVILDTSKMTPQAIQELRTAVEAVPQWTGKVVWWP